MTQAYPLQWPQGWPRARQGKTGQFKSYGSDISVATATARILSQLYLMYVPRGEVVISTNLALRLDGTPRSDQGQPGDRGAAVYWRMKPGEPTKVLAIDLYAKVEHNLAALAATLEAMRAIKRHGGAEILERAFTGFTALPPPENFDPWEVLGLPPARRGRGDIEARFRELAKIHHPDAGGDSANFHKIQKAREMCLAMVAP